MNATANIPVWFHLLSCRRLFGCDFVTFFSRVPKVMATFNRVGLNEVRGVPECYLSIQGWHSQFFSIWAEFNSQYWKEMSNFICIYQYLLIILQCCKRMQKYTWFSLPSEESTIFSLAPLLSKTSQSLTVLSQDPLARRALLELKLRELTGPSCPASTCQQNSKSITINHDIRKSNHFKAINFRKK